jgi:hypothetical protein
MEQAGYTALYLRKYFFVYSPQQKPKIPLNIFSFKSFIHRLWIWFENIIHSYLFVYRCSCLSISAAVKVYGGSPLFRHYWMTLFAVSVSSSTTVSSSRPVYVTFLPVPATARRQSQDYGPLVRCSESNGEYLYLSLWNEIFKKYI